MFKKIFLYLLAMFFVYRIYSAHQPTALVLDKVTAVKDLQNIIYGYIDDWMIEKLIDIPKGECRAISSNGKYLISRDSNYFENYNNTGKEHCLSNIYIYDVENNKQINTFSIDWMTKEDKIFFLSDNQHYVIALHGRIELYSIHKQQALRVFKIPGSTRAIARDCSLIAYDNMQNSICILHTDSEHLDTIPLDSRSTITHLVFSADNKYLVSADADNQIRVWDRAEKRIKCQFKHARSSHFKPVFFSTQNILITTSYKNRKLHDLDSDLPIFKDLKLPINACNLIYQYAHYCIDTQQWETLHSHFIPSSEDTYAAVISMPSPDVRNVFFFKKYLRAISSDFTSILTQAKIPFGNIHDIVVQPLERDRFFIMCKLNMNDKKSQAFIVSNQAAPDNELRTKPDHLVFVESDKKTACCIL
jgi:hypothetical protein